MLPKISIVTVAYNCKNIIEKTIKSVVSQTYENTEYLIIDGKSSDGTIDVIEKYRANIDFFVTEKDNGIYDAMNKGIAAATGDWIIFMNAGDFFASNEVLSIVSQRLGSDSIVVYGDIIKQCRGYYYFDKPAGIEKICTKMPVFHQATFVRLDYHKQHPFNTSFRSSGDYDFFYRSYFIDHCKFYYIPLTIACFDNTEGISKDRRGLSLKEDLRIWGKERDLVYRLKLFAKMRTFYFVKWFKQRVLGEQWSVTHEKNRLLQEGKLLEDGCYLV